MKLTLTAYNTTYLVNVPEDDLTVQEVIADLFYPMMLAVGYQPDSIAREFANGNPHDWIIERDRDHFMDEFIREAERRRKEKGEETTDEG